MQAMILAMTTLSPKTSCAHRCSEKPIRLIQITDCHLLADPDAIYRGWNTQASLQAVLEHIHQRSQNQGFDAVLATGDLVHDGSAEGYQRLQNQLSRLQRPCYAIAGNHDDPQLMQIHLHSDRVQVVYQADLGRWRLIMLNSHWQGHTAGRIDRAQLHSLQRQLAQDLSRPVLILCHHPPLDCRSHWLDNIGLSNRRQLLDTLQDFPQVRGIVCGHIHQPLDRMLHPNLRHGLRIMAAPATCRQFLPGSGEFAEDTAAEPGYREICLYNNGKILSRVVRVAQAAHSGHPKTVDNSV